MVSRRRTGARVGVGGKPAPLTILPVRCAAGAFAVAACLLIAGCSPGAEAPPFPAIFPTAHDGPPPRTDTPMNPVEVQKATEDLITERDRLNAQAPAGQGQNAGQTAANGTSGAKKPAKTAAKAKSRTTKTAPQQTAAVPSATTASAQGAGMQTAGSDAKP